MAKQLALSIKIDADGKASVAEIQRVEKQLNRIRPAASGASGGMGAFGTSVQTASGALRSFLPLIGATSFAALATNAIQAADNIGKMADTVGVGTEKLQVYRFAAENAAGMTSGALDTAIQRFSRRIGEAAQGTGELAKVIDQYGLQLRDSEGNLRSTEALLQDYADILAGASSQQERLRIATKAFDTEGARMVLTLRDGAEGLAEWERRAYDAGVVTEDAAIRSAEALNERFSIAIAGARTQMQNLVIGVVDGWSQIMRAFDEGIARATYSAQIVDRGRAILDINRQLKDNAKELAELNNDQQNIWSSAEREEKILQVIESRKNLLAEQRAIEQRIIDQRTNAPELPKVTVTSEDVISQKDLASATREHQRILKDIATPQEAYNTRIAELNTLRTKLAQTEDPMTNETYLRAVEAARDEYDKAVELTDKLTKSRGSGGRAANKSAKEEKALTDTIAEQARGYERLIAEYLPLRAAEDEHIENLKRAQAAYQLGALSAEEYRTVVEGLETTHAEAAADAEQTGDEFADAWQDSADRIDRAFEDVFESILRNGKADLDSLKNFVIDWAISLAQGLASNPIRVMLDADGIGVGGLTGDQNTSVFGGGGLTGDPNTNIFGTFGQLGQFGKIAKAGASFFGIGSGAAATLGAPGSASALTAAMGTGSFAAGSSATGIGGAISGAMSAIGAAMPIIGGITAILGATGLLDGLFGGGQKPKIWGEVHGGQIGASYRAVDSSEMMRLNQAIDQVNASLLQTAQQLGPAAMESLENYTLWKSPSTRMEGDPGTWIQDQADAIVKDMLTATMDAAVEEANKIGVAYGALASQARELAGEDIDAFVQRLAMLDQTLNQLSVGINSIQSGAGDDIERLSEHVLALGDNAAAASAGIIQLSDYMQSLETEQETLARLKPQVESLFRDLGMALPETEQGFKELIQALDLTTTNGVYAASELGKNAHLIRDYYAIGQAVRRPGQRVVRSRQMQARLSRGAAFAEAREGSSSR
jgi:hypothetical protein